MSQKRNERSDPYPPFTFQRITNITNKEPKSLELVDQFIDIRIQYSQLLDKGRRGRGEKEGETQNESVYKVILFIYIARLTD